MSYDVAVLGGGPGGYVAAIRAAQLGAKVAIIERDNVGGTCLNRGCIPTKALLASASKLKAIREAESFGITVGGISVDSQAIAARAAKVVTSLRTGLEGVIKSHGIEILRGEGRFDGRLLFNGEPLEAKNVILATGSEVARIPALGVDGQRVFTSDEALGLPEIPQRLAIIGSGAIGLEFAEVYSALGSQITLIEAMDRLAPACDGEISGQLKRLLKKKGYELVIGQKVTDVNKGEDVTITLDNGETIVADAVLVAVGRVPNTQGFQEAGLAMKARGFVDVDACMRTNLPNVWAIGDITGKAMLAHVASHQGIVAAETALGHAAEMHYDAIPACIYMDPEIAQAGITEEEAKAQGLEYKVGRFPFSACGKALADGETAGMVKVITDNNDVLLGVHILGPHASALIQEGVLAIEYRHTAQEVIEAIHAHPSLGEAFMEAVAVTLDLSTALPKPRARAIAR